MEQREAEEWRKAARLQRRIAKAAGANAAVNADAKRKATKLIHNIKKREGVLADNVALMVKVGGKNYEREKQRLADKKLAEHEPGLKGSIGEGPNHSNFSDRSSVRTLSKFRNFC